MILFDVFFYGSLVLSVLLIWQLRKRSANRPTFKFLKGISLLILSVPIIWQVLLWVVPKGNMVYEGLHLPRHLWILDHVAIVPNDQGIRQNYGEHEKQHYIYYPAPEDSPNRSKVIFYLHGGAWRTGGPHQHRYLAKQLQEAGYTVILPAYRLVPEFSYEDLQADVDNALRHSLYFLHQAGITEPELLIGGTSAGGNLGALLAYNERRWVALGIDRKILKGMFSIAGVLNMDEMVPTFLLQQYTGPTDSKTFQLASPINLINKRDAFPFLCLHSKSDGLAPFSGAQTFVERLQSFFPEQPNIVEITQASHLETASQWYYDASARQGQLQRIMDWIQQVLP